MGSEGIFAAIFHRSRDREAVTALKVEAIKSANHVIGAANALEATIQGMVDRKRALDGKPHPNAQTRR